MNPMNLNNTIKECLRLVVGDNQTKLIVIELTQQEGESNFYVIEEAKLSQTAIQFIRNYLPSDAVKLEFDEK